ncbi:MAG: hypothetical protein HLUCCA12_04810 [Rhodobacteraceae bacterium HLUCCA12]|nr:MAG: hypothetical protein HLUCCA12_04810 [Rhodobacteraceae bacterium HLUCCA12]
MTALTKYQRLEGPGLWRGDPQAQRRDVVVALGEASLVITDSRSGAVLSHWSLPAVRRLNPGRMPALYAPEADGNSETLELDDDTLIDALETIRAALVRHPPLRQLRRVLGVAALAVVAGLAVFWLPGALVRHTAGIVPDARRIEIGRVALEAAVSSHEGARICAEPAGLQALGRLGERVLAHGDRVAVVDGFDGLVAAHLPGDLVVIGRDLLERLDSAEALAGYMIAEVMAAEARDPLRDLLRHAGTRATLALLTTGDLPRGSYVDYGADRLAQPAAMPDPAEMAARFGALGAPVTAYALSLPSEAEGLAQALADQPAQGASERARLLSDGAWITLQSICVQ